MKKTLLLLSASAFLIATAQAQVTIANGSFEIWGSSAASWQDPDAWSGTDAILKQNEILLAAAGFATFGSVKQQLYKETDAVNIHEGATSAKLISKDVGGSLGVTPCMMANGAMTLDLAAAMAGEIDGLESVITVTGGTVMMGRRADSLVTYVKGGAAVNADSSTIFVQAKRKIGDSLVTIGGGAVQFSGTDAFQKVVLNVTYVNPTATATDTLIIFVLSSASLPTGDSTGGMFGATANNTIFIDDMSIYTSEGNSSAITKIESSDLGVLVYPNPATTFIHLNNEQVKQAVINIYDVTGKMMHQATIGKGITSIDITRYAAGNYIYELVDVQSQRKQTGKFVK